MWNKKQTEALEANYSELKSHLISNLNDIGIKEQLAKCCLELKRFDEAEYLYKELLQKDPNKSKYHYYLGKVYSSQELWKEALVHQECAIEFWKEYYWAYYEKARCLLGLNRKTEAIVLLESILPKLSSNQYDSVLLLNIHRILLKEYSAVGNIDKALISAEKLIGLDPNDGLNYYNLGKLKMDSKLYEEAIENFKKGLRLLNKPYIQDKIAICLAFLNRKQEAIEIYESIPYSRMDDYIHQHYGRLLFDVRDFVNAKKHLKMSIVKRGTSKINSHYYLGKVYLEIGKHKNALREFELANKIREKEYGGNFINAINEIAKIKMNHVIDEKEIMEEYADSKFGVIKKFVAERGFGFIEYEDKKEIFCHIKNIKYKSPKEGDKVKFEVINGMKGLEAADVYFV